MSYKYEILTKHGAVPARQHGTHGCADSHYPWLVSDGGRLTTVAHPDTEGHAWRRVEEPAPMGGKWDEVGDLRIGYDGNVVAWKDGNNLCFSPETLRNPDVCIRIIRGYGPHKTVRQMYEDGELR